MLSRTVESLYRIIPGLTRTIVMYTSLNPETGKVRLVLARTTQQHYAYLPHFVGIYQRYCVVQQALVLCICIVRYVIVPVHVAVCFFCLADGDT